VSYCTSLAIALGKVLLPHCYQIYFNKKCPVHAGAASQPFVRGKEKKKKKKKKRRRLAAEGKGFEAEDIGS